MQDFLKDLNKSQKEAVEYNSGPTMILAGAGSGKTRVLTTKVAYLIGVKKVNPSQILLVTFTNKAANEMKERVVLLLGKLDKALISQPFAGTFHSFCVKLLRREGKYLDLTPDFVIYDEQDQVEVIKTVMEELNISTKNFAPKSILHAISEAKNELISELEYKQYAKGSFYEAAASVYPRYQKILRENHAVDFDDLLQKTVLLLQKNPEVLKYYQDQYVYILIDEYQDTNRAQYTLAKLLAGKYRNICVVGDASQAIYSWRGADFRNLLNLQKDYLDLKIFHLEQNYRSTQKILDIANKVISKNTSHPVLSLWTSNNTGDQIHLYQAQNELDEADFIAREILKITKNLDTSLDDFAVLYRTNAQSRVLEEVFLHLGIPYILVGGVRFYERKEIKDVLAILTVLYNKNDRIAKKRIDKLGKKRTLLFYESQKSFEISKYTTIEIIDYFLEKIGFWKMFDPEKENDRDRMENVRELRSVASSFPDLSRFLENVSLVEQEYFSKTETGMKKNAVTLMTLHAAKGLEFSHVFMAGMEEGIFPHSRSLLDRSAMEEERRLCYVGITRAKKNLYLTFAQKRLLYGSRLQNMVSRFIFDMPESFLEMMPNRANDMLL